MPDAHRRIETVFVGISGPSKAGKTTTTECVVRRLCGYDNQSFRCGCGVTRYSGAKNCSVGVMTGDDFHRSRDPRYRWDDPDALDHELIWATVREALADDKLDCVIYEGFKAMTYDDGDGYKL